MKVALGTLELDESTRRKIGKAIQNSSYLKRDEARTWALGVIQAEIVRITTDPPAPEAVAEEPEQEQQQEPIQTSPTGEAPVFSSSSSSGI